MTRFALAFLFLCCCYFTAATQVPLWKEAGILKLKDAGTFTEVALDIEAINKLYAGGPTTITVPFTDAAGLQQVADLALYRMDHVKVKLNNDHYTNEVALPKLYAGKIRGAADANNVMLTIAPGYCAMQVYFNTGSMQMGMSQLPGDQRFFLRYTKDMLVHARPYECSLEPAKEERMPRFTDKVQQPLGSADKCTFVFVDCGDSLYISRSRDLQRLINYVYTLWNDMATCYRNEQLNVLISEINVWTTADPVTTMSTSTLPSNRSFADYYKDNYWGNMAMHLDWSGITNGGIAGGFGWAKGGPPNECGNYNSNPVPSFNFGSFAYCNLQANGTFTNFPLPDNDWAVYCAIHELGHLFGSRHTQSCSWPDGPIDDCVAREGTCTETPPTPTNGGTIMSYCHQTDIGINYNNGFGPLPGNVIRNFVENSSCITNCYSCTADAVVGALNLMGLYHIQVSNQIIANGPVSTLNTLLKLDAGQRVVLSPGFRAGAGSKVQVIIDGCNGIR